MYQIICIPHYKTHPKVTPPNMAKGQPDLKICPGEQRRGLIISTSYKSVDVCFSALGIKEILNVKILHTHVSANFLTSPTKNIEDKKMPSEMVCSSRKCLPTVTNLYLHANFLSTTWLLSYVLAPRPKPTAKIWTCWKIISLYYV